MVGLALPRFGLAGRWPRSVAKARMEPAARNGREAVVMLFALVLLLTIGCIAFVLARPGPPGPRPDGLRGRIRARGSRLLLLPVARAAAVMAGGAHGLIPAELGLAVLAIVLAPKLAVKLVPIGVLGLAVFGLMLARTYHDGNTSQVQYLFVHAGPGAWGYWPVLAEAGGLFVAGLWLLLRPGPAGAGLARALAAWWRDRRRGGISAAHGLLLIPVVGLAMQLLGPGNWFGIQAVDGLDAALIDLTAATAALVLVFRSRAWATTVAAAGLLVLGAYGWLIAVCWPAVPGFAYGFSDPRNSPVPSPLWSVALQGSVLLGLGLWLAPRVMRHQLAGPADLELADRARQLTQRVQTLTRTRTIAVDAAAAELRRIERDLHDGAQARMVALGMSLQAAERLFASNPEAALALVTEAKEASSRALADLRDLVRGIYPPVLADRGLADALRSLALDSVLPVEVAVDLPGEPPMPVAAAVYFAVAEALANAARHAAARTAAVGVEHADGMLRASVTDDGRGGADASRGTGL